MEYFGVPFYIFLADLFYWQPPIARKDFLCMDAHPVEYNNGKTAPETILFRNDDLLKEKTFPDDSC